MTGTSPTIRQRELGRRLRELRNRHGLTVDAVAGRLLCSPTKISRLETGARRPNLRDVRDLCNLYGVDEATSADLMHLARGAREQGWWTKYEDLKLDPYLGLEQVAVAITSYTALHIPALLQTEEYARALIKTIAPKMDAKILGQRVEVRMLRQRILDEDNHPRYRVLLDEAVLHRNVGGPALMAAQLGYVLEAQRHGKVTVQVIPFNIGALAAQDSNFVLLEFGEESNTSPMVFVEGLTANQYIEREEDIARYREALGYLRDSALSPRDSVQRITEIKDTRWRLELTERYAKPAARAGLPGLRERGARACASSRCPGETVTPGVQPDPRRFLARPLEPRRPSGRNRLAGRRSRPR